MRISDQDPIESLEAYQWFVVGQNPVLADGAPEIKNYRISWLTLLSLISGSGVPVDIEFRVDIETGAISGIPDGIPASGTSTITLSSTYNRVRVIRNHIPQSQKNDGGTYFTFNSGTHELTFFGALQPEELIQIWAY